MSNKQLFQFDKQKQTFRNLNFKILKLVRSPHNSLLQRLKSAKSQLKVSGISGVFISIHLNYVC